MYKILASLAIVLFCTAGTAHALQGFYIAPKLGYSLQNFDDPRFGPLNLSDRDQGVWGGGLALGYDMRMMQGWLPLRVELEGFFRESGEENFTVLQGNLSNRARVTTLFANAFYDIPLGMAFTPYVGLGIGMANVDYRTNTDLALDLLPAGASNSDDQWNFAWNIGAGVAYTITQNLDIDFNYRYVDVGEGEVKVGGFRSDSDIYLHEFLLGLRLTFR
jgi:opacity protein-like surface antigen